MGNLCFRLVHTPLFGFRYLCVPKEDLHVSIKQGVLRGEECKGVIFRKTYYAFLGIPYARPPIGDLRFQNPQPADPWYGVYDATYERNSCSQVGASILWMKFVVGDEDCLYLNVYTPEPPNQIKVPKAVMVFIHGGGFVLGSGSKKVYSADFLMTRDIVLVTMNYRLHALGFLNLGLPNCPGNVGMKDQVLALKWVKENISAFGGDPNNVTIFGESAGSSSVHFHLLSPSSKGLFHKAIMESGSAVCPWGVIYNPVEQAFDIGRRCGYMGNDPQQLVAFLKQVPTRTLTLAAADMIYGCRQKYPARFNNMAPSIEVIEKDAFLLDWPMNLAKTATPVPTICGVNNKEGMLVFMGVMDANLVEKLKNDFSIILKHNFKINPQLVPYLSIQLKKLYFGDKEVGMETAEELAELFSHLIFLYTYEGLEFLTNSKNPPFIYEFSYYGPLNFITKLVNFIKRLNVRGASHGDELFYLFYPQITLYYPHIDGNCLKVLENMTLMWTNFAKYGDPSTEIQWKPSTLQEPCYMSIDKELQMKQGKFYGEKLQSFKSLLQSGIDPNAQPYDIFDLLRLLGILNMENLISY